MGRKRGEGRGSGRGGMVSEGKERGVRISDSGRVSGGRM